MTESGVNRACRRLEGRMEKDRELKERVREIGEKLK